MMIIIRIIIIIIIRRVITKDKNFIKTSPLLYLAASKI